VGPYLRWRGRVYGTVQAERTIIMDSNSVRVSGDEPATRYDLDAGVVTYQPGRSRLVW
jgi:hypothetical protein